MKSKVSQALDYVVVVLKCVKVEKVKVWWQPKVLFIRAVLLFKIEGKEVRKVVVLRFDERGMMIVDDYNPNEKGN